MQHQSVESAPAESEHIEAALPKFLSKTISVPRELWPAITLRLAEPIYSESFSAYVRTLVIRDLGPLAPAAAVHTEAAR